MSKSCGGGRFVRDDRGVWRYGLLGQPVSGAQDMTLTNYFNFPRSEGVEGKFVQVPRGMAIENTSLEFCLDFDSGRGAVIQVPAHAWEQQDRVIGLWAPELQEEGGIRGMMFDPEEAPRQAMDMPVAPNKPDDIRGMNMSFRRHLRRKGWVPQEIPGGGWAYWEPWRDDPRETGPRYLPDAD